MQVVNPATGEVVADVPEDHADTIVDRYHAARVAQPGWAATPLGDRLHALHDFGELVESRIDSLATVLTTETGKPITQARNELRGLLPRVEFFVDHAAEVLAPQTVYRSEDEGIEEIITHEPLGVIANISAWNYPWFVSANVFLPALATGNAVLFKPSEYAPRTGLAIAQALHESGVPSDVFATITGGPAAGGTLLAQPVDGVFFTGSYRTGRHLAAAVADRLVRVQLELGGKDPAYVTDDVDPAVAGPAVADGAFYNAGQSCCAVERVYVHHAVHDAFLDAFVAAVESFRTGDPLDDSTYLGPLTRPQQLEVLDAQVADAVGKGARVLTGGQRRAGPGNWFEPTVLADVNHDMSVMRDESFGPIIGIQRVDGDDEAVSLMDDTEYGLTASVFGADRDRAQTILRRLAVGSAYWNCCDRVSPRLPWSGRRHSGIGATLGTEGIAAFTQPKAWHLRSAP